VVVVGVALRTLVWWPSHNLFGVLEYDDGVYYAAARTAARWLPALLRLLDCPPARGVACPAARGRLRVPPRCGARFVGPASAQR